MKSKVLVASACVCALFSTSAVAPVTPHYLFVWAGDTNKKASDFLAVIDVTPQHPRYGRVIASVAAGEVGTGPHHTEYTLSESGFLFANGFKSGKSFVFDVRNPLQPKVVQAFDDVQGYMHPHSFVRLPNGHVVASFHMKHGERGGGLVELDNDARVVRVGSAVDPLAPDVLIRPYSMAVVPKFGRLISTSSAMPLLDGAGVAVQVWRLSDLKLLKTVRLTPGSRGYGHEDPQEPRLLADGKSVLVQTRSCGLHLVTGIDTDTPRAQPVYTFDGGLCGVPIVVGHYWIEAVPIKGSVVVLDVANPAKPVKVSELSLGEKQFTHWLAWDEVAGRIILDSGGDDSMLFMLKFDRNTGAVSLDDEFRNEKSARAGFSMHDVAWPHGFRGTGIPHGAVFSR